MGVGVDMRLLKGGRGAEGEVVREGKKQGKRDSKKGWVYAFCCTYTDPTKSTSY